MTNNLLRRVASIALALTVLATTLAAEAQEAGKTYRIGILRSALSDYLVERYLPGNLEGFGYVAGKNVVFEKRIAIGTDEQFSKLADELVRLSVDVMVVEGTPAVRAAKDATQTIPILMLVETDPVKAGLVASLARPGGNVTGITAHFPEVSRGRLELLKETVPGLRRVGVLWNAANPDTRAQWESTRTAAKALGLELQSLEVTSMDDEVEPLIEAAINEKCGALLILHDRVISQSRSTILSPATQLRLPIMYPSNWYTRYGGLMSYGPSEFDLNHRLATQVDKVLMGARPSDVPVERPETELYVNTDAASAIHLTIPPAVLKRADRVLP